ncbi:hypothetical protein ACA910_009949 [Epithemia clementina (nom. ined.)]
MTTKPMAISSVCRCLVAGWMAGLSLGYTHIGRREILEQVKTGNSTLEIYSSEEEPHFLRPRYLAPGDIATVVRRDNGQSIDPGTFFIGLPPELTDLFQNYVKESGILEVADELLYTKPVIRGENRLYSLKDGTTWGARTSNNWIHAGDMTWIDPADEWTYEKIIDIYRKAGFDRVLDTLGEKFGCEGLWIDGTSFIVVSHFNGNNIHTDLDGMEGAVFNILFPLVIPSTGGMLEVADRESREGIGANFRYNQGVLVGGESPHGTGNVDYRETREFRLAIAVYMDDINPENVEEFDDDTASFPPGGDMRYLLTQAGRHWGGVSGEHASLKNDKGRRPYKVRDENPLDCPKLAKQGDCMKLPVRNMCIKSCQVYLEDQVYYEKLGKLLDWPTETER